MANGVQSINNRAKIISEILRLLKIDFHNRGYLYIHSILLNAWTEKNDDWNNYDRYISALAFEKNMDEKFVIAYINQGIRYIWITRNTKTISFIERLFGRTPDRSNVPSWKTFMRTLLSIIFFCEEKHIDIIEVFTDLSDPKDNKDNYYKTFLAGYIIMLLKKIDLSDAAIDELTKYLDNIIAHNDSGEAFISYIKHKSDLFSAISFEGIVISPEYYDMSVSELFDDDMKHIRIINALIRNGISHLKDLQFFTGDDIKRFKMFGTSSYNSFVETLKRKMGVEQISPVD